MVADGAKLVRGEAGFTRSRAPQGVEICSCPDPAGWVQAERSNPDRSGFGLGSPSHSTASSGDPKMKSIAARV